MLPSESEHKTEMGLVKLRVRSAERGGCSSQREFRARMGNRRPASSCRRWSEEGVEVVLVLPARDRLRAGRLDRHRRRRDRAATATSRNLALPVSEEQVLAALRKLKLWTLLQGFRWKAGRRR